jgi:hypothetical protein
MVVLKNEKMCERNFEMNRGDEKFKEEKGQGRSTIGISACLLSS